MKIWTWLVCPYDFPNPHDIIERKLAFKPNKEPSEAKVQIAGIFGVKIRVKLWIVGLE